MEDIWYVVHHKAKGIVTYKLRIISVYIYLYKCDTHTEVYTCINKHCKDSEVGLVLGKFLPICVVLSSLVSFLVSLHIWNMYLNCLLTNSTRLYNPFPEILFCIKSKGLILPELRFLKGKSFHAAVGDSAELWSSSLVADTLTIIKRDISLNCLKQSREQTII